MSRILVKQLINKLFCSISCFYNNSENKIICSNCTESYTIFNDNCYLMNIDHCEIYDFENIESENKLQCKICKDGY